MSRASTAVHLFFFEHQLKMRLQPLNASTNLQRAPNFTKSQHQLGESTNFQLLQAPTRRQRHLVSPSTTLPPLFSSIYKRINYNVTNVSLLTKFTLLCSFVQHQSSVTLLCSSVQFFRSSLFSTSLCSVSAAFTLLYHHSSLQYMRLLPDSNFNSVHSHTRILLECRTPQTLLIIAHGIANLTTYVSSAFIHFCVNSHSLSL